MTSGNRPSPPGALSSLPTQRLGSTDMELTRVGLGTWAMGGLGPKMTWGAADDDASSETIIRAVELGINWVDTAAFYGFGHSEEVLGETIAQLAEVRPALHIDQVRPALGPGREDTADWHAGVDTVGTGRITDAPGCRPGRPVFRPLAARRRALQWRSTGASSSTYAGGAR